MQPECLTLKDFYRKKKEKKRKLATKWLKKLNHAQRSKKSTFAEISKEAKTYLYEGKREKKIMYTIFKISNVSSNHSIYISEQRVG